MVAAIGLHVPALRYQGAQRGPDRQAASSAGEIMSQQRIIELQKSLKIARAALERIKYGTSRAEQIAETALDEMWKLEPKQQLQGIVGHGKRSHSYGR